MSHNPNGNKFRFLGRKLPPVEDRRFVMGKGKFVADIRRPGMAEVAIVSSPYAHARITRIDVEKARQAPGVLAVVTGPELAAAINAAPNYLDTPGVKFYPLAVEKARYAGEWVVAIVAEDRYAAEDAAELVEVDYDPLPVVTDSEQAMAKDSPLLHEGQDTNIMFQRTFTWGPVAVDFAAADFTVRRRFRWNRHSGVPIETMGVVAEWNPGDELLEVWASIQMPQFPENIAFILKLRSNQVRVHYDTDVGGSYGTKRGLKHAVLMGHLARLTGRPVRFIEDRLEYMRGGGAHGPDRIFEAEAAATRDGIIKSFKIRTIDDNGAYPGRSPMQMAKPVGAIVGAYRINSVQYEAIAVVTNKTEQVAYRGFGQSPTNFVIERLLDLVAAELKLDPVAIREKNFIQPEQFPYKIPSGTTYDSGDYPAVMTKAVELAGYARLREERAAARAAGRLVGVGVGACIEPGGGNANFLPLFNPKNQVSTFPEGVMVKIDRTGQVTAAISFPSAGHSHQTMIATMVGEELHVDPLLVRVVHYDTLVGLPTQTPVASRMTIVAGTAAVRSARLVKDKMLRIAAHNLRVPLSELEYRDRAVVCTSEPNLRMEWADIVDIAHRKYHQMPMGEEPGLQAIYVQQVPKGGKLPTADGYVQMYPCYSFGVHIPMVEVDPGTGLVKILKYYVAHDCGTVINPQVVDGMLYGGIAHGIGGALYEEFVYDGESGQLLSSSFMDYLMPSTLEMPDVAAVEHCTPSPLTAFGQKGVGEGGYMTAPAALVSAVEDALKPLGVEVLTVPMSPDRIRTWIKAAQRGQSDQPVSTGR